MAITRRAFLAATGALAAGPPLSARRRAYTLEPDAHGHTLKDAAGRVALGYLTSKPEGLTGNSACCVHPFNTPAGESATDIAPADHRPQSLHHRERPGDDRGEPAADAAVSSRHDRRPVRGRAGGQSGFRL